MHTLNSMNNVQRAKLLCDLMPEEIPAFLDAIKQCCHNITSDPEKIRQSFEKNPNPILSANDWIQFAHEISQTIDRYGKQLQKSKLFSDQLFDGLLALFTAHCLNWYAAQLPTDSKFKQAAALLFY